MIYVDGASVYLPRGETASFDIVFGNILPDDVSNPAVWFQNDEIPENGTKIRFSIKVNNDKLRPVLCKDMVVWNGFVTIPFETRDTRWLPFGEYSWDVRLFYDNVDEDDVNTPIAPHPFYITEVVGNV